MSLVWMEIGFIGRKILVVDTRERLFSRVGGGPVCNFFQVELRPTLYLGDVKIITGSRTQIAIEARGGAQVSPSSIFSPLRCGPPHSRTAVSGVSAELSGVTHN